MKLEPFRTVLLGTLKVIGLYGQYAQLRFNMNRNLIITIDNKSKKEKREREKENI